MSRCYILGAGFSHAVSDLPVMNQMVAKFREILEDQRKVGHNNPIIWSERVLKYLDLLEYEFFEKPCINTEEGERYEKCNFKENLEALVSFIDLNLSGAIHATVIDNQNKKSDYTKRSLFWNYDDLEELRSCIQNCLYLTLIGPVPEKALLSAFVDQLTAEDSLITFNYDLTVETSLYRRGRWNPSDGYGLDFDDSRKAPSYPDLSSEIILYKLHGSLNWESSALRLRYFYDDGSPIFPGYLDNEQSHPYQGKHTGNWLMPSFVKQFSAPGLLRIWTTALEELRRRDEIVSIGYSLPKEDSAACMLLGVSGLSNKRVTLVNPQANWLRERYQVVTGNTQIRSYTDLEAYLGRDE